MISSAAGRNSCSSIGFFCRSASHYGDQLDNTFYYGD